MRVIAIAGEEEFLFKGTETELSNLMGFSEKYYCDSAQKTQLKIGGEIKVSEIYRRATLTLQTYEELYSKFVSIKKQLSKLTDLMKGKEIIKDDNN